jgi:hypothetical protein
MFLPKSHRIFASSLLDSGFFNCQVFNDKIYLMKLNLLLQLYVATFRVLYPSFKQIPIIHQSSIVLKC